MMNTDNSTSSEKVQCVGKLEMTSPKSVEFLCGLIPIPTDISHTYTSYVVPSTQTVNVPSYRMLPAETDLKYPPSPTTSIPNIQGASWDDEAIVSKLARKGEALAVSGLVEYGDEIDVIAPAYILKQIFKIPYTKGQISIAVYRVGKTLILNAWPDVEEGERFTRLNQPKCSDESLFMNFVMHSVQMDAYDCPPTHFTTLEERSKSSALPSPTETMSTFISSERQTHDMSSENERSDGHQDYSSGKQDGKCLKNKKQKRSKACDPVKKAISEKPRCLMQESEKYRCSNDVFFRVFYWQFHNFRVLLGSDLLLFRKDKYESAGLHLWDVSRKVTRLTWLEVWLDNLMASASELAICYHRNGVVKGYEHLRTDDIYLLKGVSEDGTLGFHPYVVQQNGLSVLRFLQANCKQDPGAYLLYKNAREEVIQLFDLSAVPQRHPSESNDSCSSSFPPLIHRGRSDSLLSLGTLLYRIAHRLSLSMAPESRLKCAQFVRKCLDLLDEPDHLVVRAFAHEQLARLILNSEEKLDIAAEVFPLVSDVKVTDQEDEYLDIFSILSESIVLESSNSVPKEQLYEVSGSDIHDINNSESKDFSVPDIGSLKHYRASDDYTVHDETSIPVDVIQATVDPISWKLAAIHHVSQAIKSLRWTRQLQDAKSKFVDDETMQRPVLSENNFICACGDTDCFEVHDIRGWLPTMMLDQKLWKLVLLLGESYLALGQAYVTDGQLLRALKVVEVACFVYGSVPQYLPDVKFISTMCNGKFLPNNREEQGPVTCDERQPCKTFSDVHINPEGFSSTYLFWTEAWLLVGNVYVSILKKEDTSELSTQSQSTQESQMSSEVVKEFLRLKKKLGQDLENCSTCSLVNCSCQCDRVSSGISASSCMEGTSPLIRGKRQSKRSHLRSVTTSLSRNSSFYSSSIISEKSPKSRSDGIFKYLQGPGSNDKDHILSLALICYESAYKSLGKFPSGSLDLQLELQKIALVFHEFGDYLLCTRVNFTQAEAILVMAIDAFRKVFDSTKIIEVNCSLGYDRRLLAEEMVLNIEVFKSKGISHDAYVQALDDVKEHYAKSLSFYGAAKSELTSGNGDADDTLIELRNSVYYAIANTYMGLGLLLSNEETDADIYVDGAVDDKPIGVSTKRTKEHKKSKITAIEAISEALSIYESLGDLRKEDAAFAYFKLARCHLNSCLLLTNLRNMRSSIGIRKRVNEHLALAERNWQKAAEFYSANRHPIMYLTILIERSASLSTLSVVYDSQAMLESALTCLFEGRHVSEHLLTDSSPNGSDICAKFWAQLQMLLKKVLAFYKPKNPNKKVVTSEAPKPKPSSKKIADVEKLKEIYKISIMEPLNFHQLEYMNNLWVSAIVMEHETKSIGSENITEGPD